MTTVEASTGSAGDAQESVNLPVRQPDSPEAHAKEGNPLNDELEAYIESLRAHYHVPGISIGVVHNDETYLSGYGQASVEPSVDATEDTLFYIGSITKSILAASLLHTLENHKPDEPYTLDTKIRDVLPGDFVLRDEYATQRATIRDAVHHRVGLPRHDVSYGGEGFTVQDAVRSLRHLPMSAELREKFQYCNMGYMTLQHVIETITGKFLGDVYEEAVFKPLGMTATVAEFKKARESAYALATGYSNTDDAPHRPQPHWDSRIIGPGGVISTARDMTAYLRAMIAQTGLPLSDESYKALCAPGMVVGMPSTPHQSNPLYAAGWFVSTYRGHRLVSHGGAVPGFAAEAGFLPDLGWGTVVLTNGDSGGHFAAQAAFYKLVDDVLGIPEADRIDHVEKFDGFVRQGREAYLKSREKLFPKVPSPPLPRALPLKDYEGTYMHPGYRSLTFEIAKPEGDLPVKETTTEVLHAVKVQSEWNVTFDLEHVSGEHFVCYMGTLVRSPLVQMVTEPCRAEFDIGADGKVSKLGIQIERSLGKVWFDKV